MILFVHGAWHAAWCWNNFQRYFTSHGYKTHAVTLRRTRWGTIGDYVEDIASVKCDEPPIIVAHSMGSFVTHHYLKKHPAAGVAFITPVPPRGAWRPTWHAFRRHPLVFAKVNLKMSLYPLVATEALATEFLGDIAQYQPMLQDESYLAYLGMLFTPVLKRTRVPAMVIGATDDAIIDASDIRSAARFYGVEPLFFSGMHHDMMLEPRWEEVADAIRQWVSRLR